MNEDRVRPIARQLPAGHVESLEHVSSELAAAALTDLFLRTGSAQARVTEPDEVRRLVRLDCRRRGCRVRTLGVQRVVVVYDNERYDAFLATEAGRAYKAAMEHRVLSAFESFSPAGSPLRLVPTDEPDSG